MKLTSRSTMDVNNQIDYSAYSDFAQFLNDSVNANVKKDFATYYAGGESPDLLPDNKKYLRQIYKAGIHYDYRFLEVLELAGLTIAITDDIPKDVKEGLKRLRSFEQYGGHGRFNRVSDFIKFHDYVIDNLDRFTEVIEHAETVLENNMEVKS